MQTFNNFRHNAAGVAFQEKLLKIYILVAFEQGKAVANIYSGGFWMRKSVENMY